MRIFAIFILLLSFSAGFAQKGTVIAENANLRGTASPTGKVVDILAQNTSVDILTQRGPWFLVQTAEYAGWLHGDTIRINNTVAPLGGETYSPDIIYSSPPRPRATPAPVYSQPPSVYSTPRTPASSRSYIRGPRGGCYYYTASGRKQYVDRSLCS